MDILIKSIENQLKYNKGKNLFRENGETEFKFVDETIQGNRRNWGN